MHLARESECECVECALALCMRMSNANRCRPQRVLVCVCVCVEGGGGSGVKYTLVFKCLMYYKIHGVYATTAAITMPSAGVGRERRR